MLLYIILCTVPAYLMLFAALSIAAYLHNAFFAIDSCKWFLFSCFINFINLYKFKKKGSLTHSLCN